MTRIVHTRLIILLVLLVVGGSLFGYRTYRNRPGASEVVSPKTTTPLPIPELAQTETLNTAIKTSLNTSFRTLQLRSNLPTTGAENVTCKQLAQRAPLLISAISQAPDQAQSLFLDPATLAKITPFACPTNTVEKPGTTVSGSVQVTIVDSFSNATIGPDTDYDVTAADGKRYAVVYSDYQQQTKTLPITGQTVTATGTLIDQTLLTNSSATAVASAPAVRSATPRTASTTFPQIHKTLVVFFRYQDSPAAIYSLADTGFQTKVKQAFLANQTYWNQATWNKIQFQGLVASTPADYVFQTLGVAPFNSADCGNSQMNVGVDSWLEQKTVSYSAYSNIVGVAPEAAECRAAAGWGSMPGTLAVTDGTSLIASPGPAFYRDMVSHELGHNLGLNHGSTVSYGCAGSTAGHYNIDCPPTITEYGWNNNIMDNATADVQFPKLDIPSRDKELLGIIPTLDHIEEFVTTANTAQNPKIVNLYSNDANPTSLPVGASQHFYVSSDSFDYTRQTQSLDMEYRPSENRVAGSAGSVMFYVFHPGQDNHTYLLVDRGNQPVTLALNQTKTINNVKLEFTKLIGLVATVKITYTGITNAGWDDSDVIGSSDASDDGSWDSHQAEDFLDGKDSTEEQELRAHVQADANWWLMAFRTASRNCNTSYSILSYPEIGAIMKKACWQDSSLTALYATYWPDLATNRTSGLFVGTQAWINNAPLVASFNTYEIAPNGLSVLTTVHDASWGIEADRLLAVYLGLKQWGGTQLADVPAADIYLVASCLRPARPPMALGEIFTAKVTKQAGALLFRNTTTGNYYVVNFSPNSLAESLTNSALASADRADLSMLVVKPIVSKVMESAPKIILTREVSKATQRFVGWKVVTMDGLETESDLLFKSRSFWADGHEIKTMLFRNKVEELFLVDVDALGAGQKVTFNLNKMFAGTNLPLYQQLDICVKLIIGLNNLLQSDSIKQGIPKSLAVIKTMIDGIIVDSSALALREYEKSGTVGWTRNTLESFSIGLKALEMHNFSHDYLVDVGSNFTIMILNHEAMKQLGTIGEINAYGRVTTTVGLKKGNNPISRGLVSVISGYSEDYIQEIESHRPDTEPIQALIAKLEAKYSQLNPGLSTAQVSKLMEKNVVNAYMKYGPAAFDHMIATPAGPFSSLDLSNKLFAANASGSFIEVYAYIEGLNVTKVNIIPPATFAP